ncbi:MAG: glycosyltransferase [Weeksellaceae bacterium]
MKVAILTGGYPSPDNPSKSIFNLRAAKGLQNYAEITVYHYRFWKPGRPMLQRYVYEGVNTVAVSLPFLPMGGSLGTAFFDRLWMKFSEFLLKKELKTYDVFHSIGLGAAPIAAHLSKKCKKKHVAQAIGSDLLVYLPKKEKYFGLKNWTKNTQMVVCNSRSLKEVLLKNYPHLKAEVAYRGTDLSKFQAQGKPRNPSPIHLLFLGGFANRKGSGMGSNLKGGETLKEVIEILDKKDKLQVVFNIGGPESASDNIKEWRQQLKHPERVQILGVLKPQEIPTQMQKADGVLLPSLSEGLPNVGMEAIASACLLIASKVGGVPEVIEHQGSGLILEPGNTEEWKNTLEKVILNFENYHPLILKAVQTAHEKFNAENYPKHLMDIYKKLQ